jgi:hypothetical protein
MNLPRRISQREFMRGLVRQNGHDMERVCRLFAQAERVGVIQRASNQHKLTPEEYAVALWRDGVRKEWL